MTALTVLADGSAPLTNRGVYPAPRGWTEPAFDYYRASPACDTGELLSVLTDKLARMYRDVHFDTGPPVRHYEEHRRFRDWRGHVLASVFWGGANVRPNVESKGSFAPSVARILRELGDHSPSRVDVKRDATAPGLFGELRALALTYRERLGLTFGEIANHDPDKGDTLYLGSRKSQAMLRIYQPGLKRAQEEGRTGDQISSCERQAARVELEFKPQKQRAKRAAATLCPDAMWGISEWVAEFAAEVFRMNVKPISIAERRESNHARALRFMSKQYRAHLQWLLDECYGDPTQFGLSICDLADLLRVQGFVRCANRRESGRKAAA